MRMIRDLYLDTYSISILILSVPSRKEGTPNISPFDTQIDVFNYFCTFDMYI